MSRTKEQMDEYERKQKEGKPPLLGRVECTIPQRQYENIKITYEFHSLEQKEQALRQIIADCITYHRRVEETLNQGKKELKKIGAWTVDGVSFQFKTVNGKDRIEQMINGQWVKISEEQ